MSASAPRSRAPTDVSNPQYYHKVVDCQWACPAHTNVPEYIRLIAQGRFTESYLLNRESNVFPGILGRTCDRPCEPACRRGRVDGKPVAICRLKRVAADNRDDITEFLPKAPHQKNGKRVALIGAGPSSLTVANDLMPLGYEVVIYEKLAEPGGLMRINIPSFRLPASVLDDEVGYILNMGVDIRYNSPVTSMRSLLAEGYDAEYLLHGSAVPLDHRDRLVALSPPDPGGLVEAVAHGDLAIIALLEAAALRTA
jgi:NADPH-dependent glutamate synthase beta subunit-like oxidoreductase